MKKNYYSFLLLVFCVFLISNRMFSQTTIAKNEFLGPSGLIANNYDTAAGTLTPNDNWGFFVTAFNGSIDIVNDVVLSAPNSLKIRDWWDNNEQVEFDDFDVAGYTDIEFSIDYASTNSNFNSQLWIQYAYNGGAWETAQLLIDVNVNRSFADGAFTLPMNDGAGPGQDGVTSFKFKVYNTGYQGSDEFYIDDVYLRGTPPPPPVAVCQDIVVDLDAFGNVSILASQLDNGSTVSIGSPILSIDKEDFTCDDVGDNTVVLSVQDSTGQTDTCVATVTVNAYSGAMIAPVVDDVVAYCEYAAPTPSSLNYKCENIVPTPGGPTTFSTPGNYSIIWTYTGSDDSVTVTQNITLNAQAAPSNVTVNNIEGDNVQVNWDNQFGTSYYDIRYRLVGEVSWISDVSPTNTYNITGLLQLSDYEFQVGSVCGGSTIWASVQTFKTGTYNYCTPANTSNGSHYITNFSITGEDTTGINNNSLDDGGYADYTDLSPNPILKLYKGNSYTASISVNGGNSGWAIYIDLNQDGVFNNTANDEANPEGEFFDLLPGEVGEGLSDIPINIPDDAISGTTLMRVGARRYWSSNNACGNTDGQPEEIEDYAVNISLDPNAPARIRVSGGGNYIAGDASNTPILTDFTDFGSINIGESTTRTYTVSNSGSQPLVISDIILSNTTDFSIVGTPYTSPVAPGGTTTFTVQFYADVADMLTKTGTITIESNGENYDSSPFFVYNISASKEQKFYDSDGDGIFDNVDIDDDNDGIPDDFEENSCNLSQVSIKANYKFLNETFGAGVGRSSDISTLYDATTTYCLEDGDDTDGDVNSTECPNVENASLYDGEYTVHSFITSGVNGEPIDANNAIADFAWYAWAPIEDHTPGDTNGRMAIFNADVEPGVFYETTITGTIPNVPITYSFWAVNIDNKDSAFSSGELDPVTGSRIKPNVTVRFLRTDYSTVIASFSTGDITRCESGNDCDVSEWKYYEPAPIITSETTFIVQFINNSPGGNGNDLALDDINIEQTLCDMDHDGVADVFDLDSDNDGIPDVVEAGFAGYSNGKAKIDVAWVDVNKNGMLDALEGLVIPDTDGDGVPDYLDLDSDNDGLFDVDESGAQNANNLYPNFINGDGDITGDGVGDGPESESFRIKDTDGDSVVEYYGDGILDVYDYYSDYTEGANFNDAYGNDSQGVMYASTGYTLDTDGDNIPDYLDVYNDLTGIYDIHTTIYTGLDADNDGIIDDVVDTDGDGVVDCRDGNDNVFGSPRDLNESYSLYFDGRNDYVEDDNVIQNSESTIMAFIKKDVGNNISNTSQRIAGQDEFYLRVNTDNTVDAVANGVVVSSAAIQDNVWTHIAATTVSGNTTLYINGVLEQNNTSGGLSSPTTKFRIGSTLANTQYFKGEIEEVRVFNRALDSVEVKRMVYQELDDTANFDKGKITPNNIGALNANLIRYYKMDGYQDDILDDKKTNPTELDTLVGAKLYNIKDIYFQTAPLPYVTENDGDWTTANTWLHGDIWDITTKANNPYDASIIHVKHNLNVSETQGTVGLLVDEDKEFSIKNDKGLYNSWYLKLDGFIDLEGESQLVQTKESELFTGASSKLERDQQGTVNLYTYNYWSSPVHTSASGAPVDGSENFSIEDVLRDGSDPENPASISFVGGYNGSTSPMEIADYWLWKFDNYLDDNYSDWQPLTSSSRIDVGVGYTMKGTATGPETDEQNYVFTGKPNSGTIKLEISSGNDYLVGNPYPSSIDGYEFILDNENIITGTLYFWEHYGGNSHVLAEYQGGYGLYNLSGGVPAIADLDVQQASPDPDVDQGGSSTKIPRRYIPVSQGFFVVAQDGGDITFENDQRAFVKENLDNANSWFFRQNASSQQQSTNEIALQDDRSKFRIGFKSPENYQRQLLLTIDQNATTDIDWGFDGESNEENIEDMFWDINQRDFIIQGIGDVNENTILPLTVKTANGGFVEIKIDSLQNVNTDLEIYLNDGEIYHDLRASEYVVNVAPGVVTDRFKITFSNPALLSVDDVLNNNNMVVFYSDNSQSIEVYNKKNEAIKSIEIINILGQKVNSYDVNSNDRLVSIPVSLQTGVYIFNINTENATITKKIPIN
ncbi:LamG-like jellyroll fold domain-containing protein [Bizionia sp.]|uniref:LamG-like jellyroll fold domain-containing protein n=1 Tax=Bizionia sp. TaxID=1954480 RepID=UPI003A91CFCA